MPALSIVIPTRRVDAALGRRAAINACRAGADELIFVEPDDLPDSSQGQPLPPGWRLLRTPRGRGTQCARGVAASGGELVMVLHDDTDLPAGAAAAIARAFADPRVGMACFRLRFDRRHWLLGIYAAASRLESVLTTFGDQAMVIRRRVYEAVGGFPAWPLFEDVELARRVRRTSRIIKLDAAVTTSALRFEREGMLRRQLANGVLLGRFLLGASPVRLAALYERGAGPRGAKISQAGGPAAAADVAASGGER